MSENKLPDSNAPKGDEVHFDTSTPPGTRAMNLVLGFPILLISVVLMVYASIQERQPMYLLVTTALIVVVVLVARILFSVPGNESDRSSTANYPIKTDTSHEN